MLRGTNCLFAHLGLPDTSRLYPNIKESGTQKPFFNLASFCGLVQHQIIHLLLTHVAGLNYSVYNREPFSNGCMKTSSSLLTNEKHFSHCIVFSFNDIQQTQIIPLELYRAP